MKLPSNFRHIFAVSSVSVVLLAAVATVSSSVPSWSAIKRDIEPVTTTSKSLVAHTQGIYRNNKLKLRFNYSPQDFVVDTKTSSPSSNLNLAVIDIWSKKHAQKIRAGVYEGGTEYPANVQVSIYTNDQRLSVKDWVQKNQYFTLTRKFTNVKIAGKNAIQFESSGLYENKHTVFVNPRNSQIIVVTLSQVGYGNDDIIYQKAYDQVIKSLFFN